MSYEHIHLCLMNISPISAFFLSSVLCIMCQIYPEIRYIRVIHIPLVNNR